MTFNELSQLVTVQIWVTVAFIMALYGALLLPKTKRAIIIDRLTLILTALTLISSLALIGTSIWLLHYH